MKTIISTINIELIKISTLRDYKNIPKGSIPNEW